MDFCEILWIDGFYEKEEMKKFCP